MAIIRSSKTFEGSELKPRANTYIKSDTKTVNFGKDEKDGVYLFILGAYKQDAAGNGVWYRPTKIRDNFGIGQIKEKFAVQPNCPIDYFANKVQSFAPNMAKPTETSDENGRKRLVYPVWGRIAWRVLYNAAYFGKYEKGVHVLDLPQSGGASVIDEFVRGHQPDGKENPMINDHEAAVPVHIKLDLTASGQPWKIQINSSKTYALPEQLADTDYLYNLDDVINYPSKQQLIDKIKSCVSMEVFRKGIEGYDDGSIVHNVVTSPVTSTATTEAAEVAEVVEDDVPMAFSNPVPTKSVAPTVNIPKPNKAVAESAATTQSGAVAAAAAFLRKQPATRA